MGLGVTTSLVNTFAIHFFLAAFFLLTVAAFIPIGQLCGRVMTHKENLTAYGLNLLGSIAGVGLIMGMSLMWVPPLIWFVVCFACVLVFLAYHTRPLFAGALFALAGVAILSWPVSPGIERIHSPYQLLERGVGERGYMRLKAGGHYFQRVHDLSLANANRKSDARLKRIADYYELPYRVLGKPPESVAVVGSGTGNDVAAALRSGAKSVDAIEIDPAIVALGAKYHPERPYHDPRVRTIITDARTFLRRTDRQYDMVVYGLLDSHTLLSHASSVRLDSFVYTREAFRETRSRLKPGGLMSLSFCILSHDMGRKIFLMMKEAFGGKPPLCVAAGYDGSVIYLQTRGSTPLQPPGDLLQKADFRDITSAFQDERVTVDVSTDDWPFFYMPRRVVPLTYVGTLGFLLFLAGTVTYNFVRQKPSFGSAPFFFMGAGFMLVETKAITELGLTFGNTWQVVGIVITGILFMAFLANYTVARFQLNRSLLWFALLFASLGLGYMVSIHGGFDSSVSGKAMAVLLLTCPIFFSGIVFSTLLRKAEDIASVMAVNLIGAITGGMLEYSSMYFGFSFLYLLGMVLYFLALVSFLGRGAIRFRPAG